MGEVALGMDAKGNVIRSSQYKISRLAIAGATFTDVIATVDTHDPSYPANELGQQGFLGTGLFESHQLVLEYAQQRMTLLKRDDAKDQAACQGAQAPFSPGWNGQPVTEVQTDLGTVALWWDTGAPVSVLSKRFVARAADSFEQPASAEQRVTSKRLTLGATDFGPWSFAVWDVALPPGFEGFIGHDFFAGHIVCLDFVRDRLLVRPN